MNEGYAEQRESSCNILRDLSLGTGFRNHKQLVKIMKLREKDQALKLSVLQKTKKKKSIS